MLGVIILANNGTMSEYEITNEIKEIAEDKNLTAEEKKICQAIYSAELVRKRFDELIIVEQKSSIQNLRTQIIDEILNIYPNLDESKKTIAQNVLYVLASPKDMLNSFEVIDFLPKYEIVNGSLTRTGVVYLDDNIHQKLNQLNRKYIQLICIIDRKYLKIGEKLQDVLDPKTFDFVSNMTGDSKQRQEIENIFIKEKKKIDTLDIYSKAKGILRDILLKTVLCGVNHGKPDTQFESMYEYVGKRMEQLLTGKTM